MFVYAVDAIDDWAGWNLLETLAGPGQGGQPSLSTEYRAGLERLLAHAREVARSLGWEGDFSQGPFVSSLPAPWAHGSTAMIGWKQANDSRTFLASYFPLLYLEEHPNTVISIHRPDGDNLRERV